VLRRLSAPLQVKKGDSLLEADKICVKKLSSYFCPKCNAPCQKTWAVHTSLVYKEVQLGYRTSIKLTWEALFLRSWQDQLFEEKDQYFSHFS
jgi:hypothetical protein